MDELTFYTNAVRPHVCPREHDPFKYAAWVRQFIQGIPRGFEPCGDPLLDQNVIGLYCEHGVEYTLKVDDMVGNVYPNVPILTHATLEGRERHEYTGKSRTPVRVITWVLTETSMPPAYFQYDGNLSEWMRGGKVTHRYDTSGTIDQIRNYAAGYMSPGNRLVERWTPQTLTAFEDEQALDAAQQTWKDFVHNYVPRNQKDEAGQYKMTVERLADRLKMNHDRVRAALSRMGRKID